VASVLPRLGAARRISGDLVLITVVVLIAVLGYFGVNLLYERVDPSAASISQALLQAPFDQALPPGVVFRDVHPGDDGNVSVSFNATQEAKESSDVRFSGSPVVVSYVIFDEEAEAREIYDYGRQGLLESASHRSGRPVYEPFSVGLADEHVCGEMVLPEGRVAQTYCQFLVGKVTFEVLSRMKMLGLSDDHHLDELSRAALDHLRSAVPGVD
jgi:hypothetical protein